MLDFYAVWKLVPYVFGFLHEQWTRLWTRTWSVTHGVSAGATLEGQSFPYLTTLTFTYAVSGQEFSGQLVRRCLRRRSAERIAELYRGTDIEVRYDPRRPDRSYPVLPLGWGGFIVAGIPVFGFLAFLGFLAFAVVQNHYIEAHDAIPAGEWHHVDVPNVLQLKLPGTPGRSEGYLDGIEVNGAKPSSSALGIERQGAYFYVEVLQYPPNVTLDSSFFDRALAAIKAENPKRYVYGDEPVTLDGRTGREFRFTQPYTRVRIYLDGQRVVLLATDWHVDSDIGRFFDSLKLPVASSKAVP